jgi:hypothetical protein
MFSATENRLNSLYVARVEQSARRTVVSIRVDAGVNPCVDAYDFLEESAADDVLTVVAHALLIFYCSLSLYKYGRRDAVEKLQTNSRVCTYFSTVVG